MTKIEYCIDINFPFTHKVIITFQGDDFWSFNDWCRETFEIMGKQFIMNRETFLTTRTEISTRYILYLESEDMVVMIKLSHG